MTINYAVSSPSDVWRLAEDLRIKTKNDPDFDHTDDYFQLYCDDYAYYAHRALHIKTKTKGMQPFRFNRAQWYIHACIEHQRMTTGKVRVIVVKGRQQGLSTYSEGRGYWKASQEVGCNTVILTHEDKATNNLFDMAKRYHQYCPPELQPITGAFNGKTISFPHLDSMYKVFTAGSKGTGRSQTATFFHGCLAAGTEVICGDTGTLCKIEDFRVGDMVRTHTGDTAPVSFISTQTKVVNALQLKGSYAPILATDEHKFITAEGKQPLSGLKVGNKILFPVATLGTKPIMLKYRAPDSVRPQGGGSREVGSDNVVTSYDLGRVMGLYLAEGSIALQSKPPHAPSKVTFTVHKDEVERTLAWLKPMQDLFTSIKVGTNKGTLTRQVVCYGRSFALFMDRTCGRKDTKRTPSFSTVHNELAKGLLHGYLAGDGHFETATRRVSAPSIRSAITIGMRDIAASCGYGWASIAFKPAAIRHGRNEQDAWTFRLTGSGVDQLAKDMGEVTAPRKRNGSYGAVQVIDGYAHVPITGIEPVGERQVYDFEVDHEDHSYCLAACATSNSEVAFWPHAAEHATGIMEGISEEGGTEVILESTAYGNTGYFAEQWELGYYPGETPNPFGNGYLRVFIPWFWEPSYRMPTPLGFERTGDEELLVRMYLLDDEQIQWRRVKVAKANNDVSRFQRDYPATPEEAFNVQMANLLIDPNLVVAARRNGIENVYDPIGPVVFGVDVAREGDDATCIVIRQGRVLIHFERMYKKKSHEVAARVHSLANEYHSDAIFVDSTGGYGGGVMDFLTAVYHRQDVTGVNFASSATEEERFYRIRTEMWWNMKEWFEGGASVPDSPELQKDVCSPTYSFQPGTDQMRLEGKKDMKARGVESPDIGDALALTLAYPVSIDGMSGSYDPDEA